MGILHLKRMPRIDFIGLRFFTFAFSGVLIAAVLLGGLFLKVPLGVDFKGGLLLEVRVPQALDLQKVRSRLASSIVGQVSVQNIDVKTDFLIRLEHDALAIKTPEAMKKIVQGVFGPNAEVRRFDSVGPKVSSELLNRGLTAVFWALIAMMLYIWWRFEWRFGLAALLALLHDCFGVMAVYVIGRSEFNEAAIVAILITASYSINDTVVVFDRIRENKRNVGQVSFQTMINTSINETLSRTLLTSLTTVAALIALYFFGGGVIASFSLPILVGLLVGTYSSIFIAGPLLSWLQPADSMKVIKKSSPSVSRQSPRQ